MRIIGDGFSVVVSSIDFRTYTERVPAIWGIVSQLLKDNWAEINPQKQP